MKLLMNLINTHFISIHTNKFTLTILIKKNIKMEKIKIIREFVFSDISLFKNKNYYLTWTSRKRIKKHK